MTMTAMQVAEICRQRIGSSDASQNARYIWAIPQALNALARKVAVTPHKRQLLMTQRSSTLLTLNNKGEANIKNFAATNRILSEFLRYGNIYAPNWNIPVQYIDPAAAPLELRVATVYDHYYCYTIDGETLQAFDYRSVLSPLADQTLELVVPYVPILAGVPAALEDDLIAKVMELVTNPPADYAEDGRK